MWAYLSPHDCVKEMSFSAVIKSTIHVGGENTGLLETSLALVNFVLFSP